MNRLEQCVVVIPCFNEAGAIQPLIEEIRRVLPNVIVVDDGSTDGTAEVARRSRAELVRHETNRGKGAALRSGLAHARAMGFGRALTMDGDGQHAPADMALFLQAAGLRAAPLIVGNRLARPHGMPWVRLLVNRWMSRQLSRRAGCPLPDSQCGFRLIELEAWSALRLETEHFEIESEMLLAFRRAGHAIEFVPVQVIYKSGQSKIHPLVDSWRWFRWWWQTERPRGRQLASGRRPLSLLWPRLARLEEDARAEVK